ncbi:MAG TPA: DMT family transporter [Gaiellaceae bacterium]|nr:DMT family transporter [Gaiellaceae bacterium]
MPVLLPLIAVTAVWGVTFVQVKDAVAIYPLFAFLAVRFAIASTTLAVPAARRVRGLGQRGLAAGALLGVLLAAGYALQTAGLERTTVSSTGFITGLYVVLTPLFGLAFFRTRVGLEVWGGVVLAVIGLAMLSGVQAGSTYGDALVLASAAAQALQIVGVERFASRYDAIALTFVEMIVSFGVFLVIALAIGDLGVPRGRTVWGALLVTGVFASALAYLVQVWAQRRMSAARIAIVFSLETVFAGLFGFVLAGDRLGALGWGGCAVILAGIVLAEPAAAGVLRRLVGGGGGGRDGTVAAASDD